ncbi:MOP flippase family protein [Oscillochloris sp. ZM17-4]|uniref:MOP flippase family protein n=1 Tax=Oscillochloris sp. ZM17-4 TaxID=2866714 RepID=UPI001C7374D6|nr:MOP flippase family protein [Oscillochloris sp. ZM17-4]MBX0330767.1 MOP flippase family protein [Oscillochloris sp. ZM17-4]
MEIKRAAISGVKWSAVSQVGRQILQLLTMIILARLLLPSDFGLVGMATVVTGFVMLFTDLGTAAAIIQRQKISEDFLSGIFWMNLLFGFFAGCALYMAAPLIVMFYQEPRVLPMLRFFAITFLISETAIVQKALLERQLAFRTLAKVEIAASLAGAAIGIGSALGGAGAWSLVYQTLALTTVTAVLLWVFSTWRPMVSFQWSEATSALRYSLNLAGFNILNYFSRNVDNLLVGRYLGSQPLGYYTLAYRIMLYPLQNISQVIGRVMFPSFALMQDDPARFRRVYLKAVGLIALITCPLMFGLMGVADSFVVFVLGDQWMPVADVLIILAPVGMIQSIITTVGTIYQSMGRTEWLFRWGVVSTSLAILSIVIGLRWGIVGVASAYAIITIILAYPNFAIPFKLIGLPISHLIPALWQPFVSGALMLIAIIGLRVTLLSHANSLWVLLITVPTGALVYLLVNFLINREQLRNILEITGIPLWIARHQQKY